MGFFSKIKKWWDVKTKGTPAEEAAVSAVETAPITEPAPSPAPEIVPEAKTEPPAVSVAEAKKETLPETPEPKPRVSPAPETASEWQIELAKSLQGAEPRLSIWLAHVLRGIEGVSDDLWARLKFLFKSLEAPEEEAQDFIARFRKWLADMEYTQVEEFRSELQYRLALALELEDEEDERSRLFIKLSAGLAKTKEQITRRIDNLLAMTTGYDDAFWDELEEILIMADVGAKATAELIGRLKTRIRRSGAQNPGEFKELLRDELAEVFPPPKKVMVPSPPEVIVMIGVNGVGKTTTIAKLAHREQMRGRKVMVGAGDTFRAAASEQLKIWSERSGALFYGKTEGADPSAVAFEALDAAIAAKCDVLILDTAGRLHTKANLMEELKKIKRVLNKKIPGTPHRCIIVIDATTGQNAISQVNLFNKAVGIDEIILTKLDGTAKGGVTVAVALEFGIPITFIGLGEKMEDLRPFNGRDFAQALLG